MEANPGASDVLCGCVGDKQLRFLLVGINVDDSHGLFGCGLT